MSSPKKYLPLFFKALKNYIPCGIIKHKEQKLSLFLTKKEHSAYKRCALIKHSENIVI